MVHHPLGSTRDLEGLCVNFYNLVAYYNVKCDLIITVSLQRDTASLFFQDLSDHIRDISFVVMWILIN